MAEILDWQMARFVVYLLVLVRVLAILSVAPVIGSQNVPFQLRAGLSLVLALVLTAGLPETKVVYAGGLMLIWMAAQEALLGLCIGFLALMVFEALQMAGEVMGVQIGFALADVVDPITSESVSLLGQVLYLLGTLVFVVIGGPMMIVRALYTSLVAVSPGTAVMHLDTAREIVGFFSTVYLAAVQFAAPIVILMLLVSIIMGIIGRTVPQFNILFVGIPIRTLVGLLLMVFAMEYTVYRLVSLVGELPGEFERVTAGFAG